MDLATKTAKQLFRVQQLISTAESVRNDGGLIAKYADYRAGRKNLRQAKLVKFFGEEIKAPPLPEIIEINPPTNTPP